MSDFFTVLEWIFYDYKSLIFKYARSGNLCTTENYNIDRMLYKKYYRKGSDEKKISGRESQGAWRQDELIGGKLPSIK
jgi:hypothetical protein